METRGLDRKLREREREREMCVCVWGGGGGGDKTNKKKLWVWKGRGGWMDEIVPVRQTENKRKLEVPLGPHFLHLYVELSRQHRVTARRTPNLISASLSESVTTSDPV